ncbi:unnamed protein product [Linum trigynum]|uniref:Uncharacterized protein n=1 Tax=Linum trigynum TaxID=586398 RepID=A0AAV2ESD7_9ROSI
MEWDNNNSDLRGDEEESSFDLNDGVGPIPFLSRACFKPRIVGSWSRMLLSLTTYHLPQYRIRDGYWVSS